MFAGLLTAIAPKLFDGIFGLVDQAVEDKDKSKALAHDISTKIMGLISGELEAQRDIIVAEARSESWITRSWRPITMLTFVGLVVAKWLGFTAPGVSEEIELALLEIIQIGLGGYVVGRSAERVAKVWKNG